MRYEIKNAPLTVLICRLEEGESIECQPGAMSWMTQNMQMRTETAGSSPYGGLMGAFEKAARSALAGESVFRNTYTSLGGKGEIAFASHFPGDIIPYDVDGGRAIAAQKSAYLANTPGVQMDIFFQKKIGAGFFGGEGFIMQSFSGSGTVFLEADGSITEYCLEPGQSMIISTGHLAAMEASCSMDIEPVRDVRNIIAGGEGFFNTIVTGPGRIWLQSMPANYFAGALSIR